MNEHHEMVLYAVDCSNCGRPTVTSEICTRPDLCYPCFGELVAA
jgi:hypothetical protein